MEWHRKKKVSINSGASARGKGAANVVDLVQNNQGVTGSFIIRKGEVVLQLPDDSKYGASLHGVGVVSAALCRQVALGGRGDRHREERPLGRLG